jgi:Common central domain of tyrosinase
MALGDGIRRDIRTISAAERKRFKNALLVVQGTHPFDAFEEMGSTGCAGFGERDLTQATRMHHGAEFLPWHRALCNRFERMLRGVDPELSLHYWDWNEDPHELFTPTFMNAGADGPFEGLVYQHSWMPEDSAIVGAESFEAMRTLLERKHDVAHFVYFGGTFVNAHISFHDPCAFLLHSNVDRLFAMWQAQPGHAWRLDPEQVFGREAPALRSVLVGLSSSRRSLAPWMPAESPQPRTCVHPSIVAPPC